MDARKINNFNSFVSLMFHILKKSNNLFRKIHNNEIPLELFAKGPDDNFTTADYVIQKMFENNLEKYYSDIKIIGEEDTSKETIKDSEFFIVDNEKDIDFNFLDSSKNKNFEENEMTKNFSMKDLAFFIDPIDSTSNYIKRKYSPVTAMLGITRNEIPYFGILHYFAWEGNEQITKTIFNFPGKGVYEINLDNNEIKKMEFFKSQNGDKGVNIVASKSRTSEKVRNCFEFFGDFNLIPLGGLGHKCFKIMELDALYISSCNDMGFWDTVAGHCLLHEIGGGFYYFNGDMVKYNIENGNRNMQGHFIICANKEKLDLFLNMKNKNLKYFQDNFNI